MSTFYRYLRPLKYNFKRNAVETSPSGGICFRVVDEGEDAVHKTIIVSYSICHDRDVFDRDVAKKIADNREGHAIRCDMLSANGVALALVQHHKNLSIPTGATELYRNNDLRFLSEKVLQIRNGHRAAWQLSEMDRDTIEALDLVKFYESQSR